MSLQPNLSGGSNRVGFPGAHAGYRSDKPGSTRNARHPYLELTLYYSNNGESNTKKVLNWLQSAVERVREFAYAEPPVAASPTERPRIGVALGGGFARGIAHLGVLRVLQEENIPVDYPDRNERRGVAGHLLCQRPHHSGNRTRRPGPLDSRISAIGSFPGWVSPQTKSWNIIRANFLA